MAEMTSNRPYLVRALYDWICDNGLTPYVLVDAAAAGVRVPPQAVKDGRVVLNIAPRAVSKLELADDVISFQARFSGVPMLVLAPMPAILAIYAMENGQGMLFPPEAETPSAETMSNPSDEPPGADSGPLPGKPGDKLNHLRVIK